MTAFQTILVLVAALLAVFAQAWLGGLRDWVGAQVDLLPALMVYAALQTNLITVALLAVFGGLCFDTLSANPPGVSVLPLFVVGLLLYRRRGLILRDEPFAQFVLGTAASGAAPALTVLLLLTAGYSPLVGMGTIWQIAVMAIGGGALTPFVCKFFEACQHALSYRRHTQSSFRPDRDIRRGRS
jgi:rod shape-determining protein MreD